MGGLLGLGGVVSDVGGIVGGLLGAPTSSSTVKSSSQAAPPTSKTTATPSQKPTSQTPSATTPNDPPQSSSPSSSTPASANSSPAAAPPAGSSSDASNPSGTASESSVDAGNPSTDGGSATQPGETSSGDSPATSSAVSQPDLVHVGDGSGATTLSDILSGNPSFTPLPSGISAGGSGASGLPGAGSAPGGSSGSPSSTGSDASASPKHGGATAAAVVVTAFVIVVIASIVVFLRCRHRALRRFRDQRMSAAWNDAPLIAGARGRDSGWHFGSADAESSAGMDSTRTSTLSVDLFFTPSPSAAANIPLPPSESSHSDLLHPGTFAAASGQTGGRISPDDMTHLADPFANPIHSDPFANPVDRFPSPPKSIPSVSPRLSMRASVATLSTVRSAVGRAV